MATESPIFIVGAPRSGTTLLREILNRHPRIAVCSETFFQHYLYARRRKFGDLSDPRSRLRAVDEYLSLQRLQLFDDLPGLREKLLREATSYRAMFTCLAKHQAELQGKPRWGEKTPRHTMFCETLCEWYPGGTIVHIVRDPRDVVASTRRMPWGANSVLRNARRWLRHVVAARRCAGRPPYFEVPYEALVSQPEREVARICRRLGEEYYPSMLDPAAGAAAPPPTPWKTRSQEPITTARLEKWREELTAEEVSLVEWEVGPRMEAFGYRRAAASPSIAAIVRGLGFAGFDTASDWLVQLPGTWRHMVYPTKLAKEEYWMKRRIAERREAARMAR